MVTFALFARSVASSGETKLMQNSVATSKWLWSTTASLFQWAAAETPKMKTLKGQFNKSMNLEEIAAK